MVENENSNQQRRQTYGYGGVAQLGEHLPCKQGVDSSILFISTTAAPGKSALKRVQTKESVFAKQDWQGTANKSSFLQEKTTQVGRDGNERPRIWAHSSGG